MMAKQFLTIDLHFLEWVELCCEEISNIFAEYQGLVVLYPLPRPFSIVVNIIYQSSTCPKSLSKAVKIH